VSNLFKLKRGNLALNQRMPDGVKAQLTNGGENRAKSCKAYRGRQPVVVAEGERGIHRGTFSVLLEQIVIVGAEGKDKPRAVCARTTYSRRKTLTRSTETCQTHPLVTRRKARQRKYSRRKLVARIINAWPTEDRTEKFSHGPLGRGRGARHHS